MANLKMLEKEAGNCSSNIYYDNDDSSKQNRKTADGCFAIRLK